VKNYYVHETLKQVYKIIGSLDFVGNPTILFSSFVSGVRDLVAAPTAAFLKSPTNVKEVGIGVGKGTISLFSHSASGIFGFSARLWATAGHIVATLSMDSEYRQWHRDRIVNEAANLNRTWKRRGVQSIQEIALRPVVDIVLGVTMGATGFVLSPYRGARKGGAWGFVQGVGVGTAGVVAKPIVGIFDAFTHASQTVHDLAKSVNVLDRRFQPAVRLRLPHVFGPMNILTSFGENAARSVSILGIFPPKTKFKRRINRGKEVYVHSEVLLMEPGVATFAIVTSIRVLLVKLRKDTNNSLVPSFCWEVDLSGNSTVSSKVSDHGHNGVALTITKVTKSIQKSGATELVPSFELGKKERVRQKGKENTHRSNPSSGRSMDSAESDGREETDDLGEDLNLSREGLYESKSVVVPLTEGAPGTEYRQGETVKGDESLEWFTVLAEYQHRKQLTRLHNAVSCVVGDFDSIISEPGRGRSSVDPEGTTKFGIFTFEKGLPDGRDSHVSNIELVGDLEDLAWIQNDTFEQLHGVTTLRQKNFLAHQRQNWDYSKELEGSVSLGGPPWLIEARARAMYVSRLTPAVDDMDSDDLNLQELHSELEEEDIIIPHEGATQEVNQPHDDAEASTIENSRRDYSRISSQGHHESSTLINIGSNESVVEAKLLYIGDIARRSDAAQGINDTVQPGVSEIHKQRFAARVRDSDGDIFQSTGEFEVPSQYSRRIDSMSDSSQPNTTITRFSETERDTMVISKITFAPSTVSGSSGQSNNSSSSSAQVLVAAAENDEGSIAEFGGDSSHETDLKFAQNTGFETNNALQNGSDQQGEGLVMPTKQQAISNGMLNQDLSSASAHSRMDRLESVMEQLVILNAAQVQRQIVQAPVETNSLSGSSMHEIADTLKHELAEIREKMEERAKEDDLLRNEISLLRDQLAGRRNATAKTRESVSTRARKFPMPEINLKTMVPRTPRRSSGGQQSDSIHPRSVSNSKASTGPK
jgi:hypothetical protein